MGLRTEFVVVALLFTFVTGCNKSVPLKIDMPKEEEAPPEVPEWVELLGVWDTVHTLAPILETEGSALQSVLMRGDMEPCSRWSEISVDFKINGDIRYNTAGLVLNVLGADNFGILRIGRMALEVGLWKYHKYRPWTHLGLSSMSQDHWYNFKIRNFIKKNDWRPWTMTLTDCESGEILLQQGIENTFPLFGRGVPGLYAFTVDRYAKDTIVSFRNFKVTADTHAGAEGTLRVAPLFSDGMVIQRNKPVPVWGLATPGETVKIKWIGQTYTAEPDDSGKWRVDLLPASVATSLEMMIFTATDTVLIRNIDVGEVWLASGQSNMGMMVWQSDMSSIAQNTPPDDHLRMFMQPQWPSPDPVFDGGGKWEKATPENAREWSAVAYSFALQLREKLHMPIGIVASYWGGTSAESWLPRDVLGTDPATKPILDDYERALRALENGSPIPPDINPFNIPDQSHAPGYLYNGMIYPHIPYALQGVIWYQGESNALRGKQYETLFPMLIRSWRDAWDFPGMNFFFVQLAGYDGKLSGNEVVNAWPHIREAQRLTLNELDHTGMVVAIDLGDPVNIHPYRKNEVGKRLARLAFHDVYGFSEVVRCGPLFQSVQFIKGSAFIDFSETAAGLSVRYNGELAGFVIAGEDQRFVPAFAKILTDGKSVRVWASTVNNPVAVRYAWENNPVRANLINSAGLPASPFRTDDWPLY